MNENLFKALAKAQGQIESAKKRNLNPHFKSKYADLAAVWDACREELSSNGLSVIQFPVTVLGSAAGLVALTTMLAHESGESIQETYSMPCKDPTNPQAVGSALTYMRRYALMSVVGIAPEEDDGSAAGGKGLSTPKASPPPASNTDWEAVKADALAALAGCKTDTEKRTLYAQIRNSSIDEPHKTALLFEMSERIKAAAVSDVKQKK